jgi:hypothetical protein
MTLFIGVSRIYGCHRKKYTCNVKSLVMANKALEIVQTLIHTQQFTVSKEQLVEESQGKFKELSSSASIMPGVDKLILSNVILAVATSSGSMSFKRKRSRHEKLGWEMIQR